MKSSMLTLTKLLLSTLVGGALTLSTSVFADTYMLPPEVIAQVVSGGGLLPPDAPFQDGVRIFHDGTVQSFHSYPTGDVTHVLARLSGASVQAIEQSLKDLQPSDLVDANPSAPECADAPGTTYVGRNADDVAVALKGRFQCKPYVRKDGLVSPVPEILDGFVVLMRLQ